MLVKICGIMNKLDALAAADAGADMLGFIFYRKSKRYVEPQTAEDIVNELPPGIESVGIFVDEKKEDVLKIAEDVELSGLQFHGSETPEYCSSFRPEFEVIKAFRLRDKNDLKDINSFDVDYYLLDTYKGDSIGGTGETFDWMILRDFEFLRPLILSGGLTPENVGKAIREVAPYGVDVSTGVEKAPGKKDPVLIKKFIDNARKA